MSRSIEGYFYRLHVFLWINCLVFAQSGCVRRKADYSKVNLVDVTGLVTLDGVALPEAVVVFEDEADQTFSYGTSDSNGRYQLRFDSDMLGVKKGNKIVRISLDKKIVGANISSAEEGDDPDAELRAKDRLPARYNKASELRCVVDGSQEKFDFALTSER